MRSERAISPSLEIVRVRHEPIGHERRPLAD